MMLRLVPTIAVAAAVAFLLPACGGAPAKSDVVPKEIATSENGRNMRPLPPASSRRIVPPLTAAPLPSAKGLAIKVESTWNRASILYDSSHHITPGVTEGLLWSGGLQPWGIGYDHGPSLNDPERIEYKFSMKGTAPYAVYFVSKGEGHNFLRDWTVYVPTPPNQVKYNAAMFDPSTPNAWGLSRLAYLVSVDVNDQRGGAGIHFVITDVRILDGTPEFPPRVDDLLFGLRARFDKFVEAHQADIETSLQLKTRAIDPQFGAPLAIEKTVGMAPSWRELVRNVEATFTATMRYAGRGKTLRRACPPCQGPCTRCIDDPYLDVPTAIVTIAARYAVNGTGEVIAETQYTPIAYELSSDGREPEAYTGEPERRAYR